MNNRINNKILYGAKRIVSSILGFIEADYLFVLNCQFSYVQKKVKM